MLGWGGGRSRRDRGGRGRRDRSLSRSWSRSRSRPRSGSRSRSRSASSGSVRSPSPFDPNKPALTKVLAAFPGLKMNVALARLEGLLAEYVESKALDEERGKNEKPSERPSKPHPPPPSAVLKLHSLCSSEDMSTDLEYVELCREIEEELASLGDLEFLHVPRFQEREFGHVFCGYRTSRGQEDAQSMLEERTFGGKRCVVTTVPRGEFEMIRSNN